MLELGGAAFNLYGDAFTDLLHILTLSCFELNSESDFVRFCRERRRDAQCRIVLMKSFCRALKARCSTAQGVGRKAAEALG